MNGLEILISNASGLPIYEQITTQIKQKILSGELAAGEALPSIRALAKDLRISVITTKRAYDELEREGLVCTVAGKGCFVAARRADGTAGAGGHDAAAGKGGEGIMKGILFKDFLSAKRILTIYLLMIICFSFGGAKGVFFALCYSIMVPVNLLGFDERSRFDRYASVLPLTGLQCVADKYIVMYLSMAVMMVLSSLIVFLRTGAASAMEDMLLYAATVLATLGSIETYYNFDGLVKAKRVQTITAAQSDKVRTVYVTQNQQVKKGERLYRLEGGETVEADIAGEVTGLYVEQGGVVTAGETTAQIIDMNSLEIELNVDEYDVAAVVPGQAVQVNVLAPDVSFTGSVTALNKNGTASGDLSYYTATVAFDAAENVYPGMQVSAKVLKEQAEDAVLIRQDAVRFDDYNKPYVLVRGADGKSVEQKSVTVGVSDGMNCEITSGLNAGDTVLKSSGVTMAELMEQMQAQQRTSR